MDKVKFPFDQNDFNENSFLKNKILVRQYDMIAYLVGREYYVSIGNESLAGKNSIFPKKTEGDYEQYLQEQVFPVLRGTKEQVEQYKEALLLEQISERLRTREPYEVDIVCEIQGEIYYKRFDFYAINLKKQQYIVLKSDITKIVREREERNEQLAIALEEAEQASVAKTSFLSGISHEMRTPMNAIIGLCNIAIQDESVSPTVLEQLKKIDSSAKQLLNLINDILDMSRIESGRMILKNEIFSFRGMLEQINTMIAPECRNRGLEYECDFADDLNDYYVGDEAKLKQVLVNILDNAVKFTPNAGKVSFTVKKTAHFNEKSTLRFQIKDTGIGIDEKYISQIFDSFSKEDITTTNKYGGTGLGLSIAKNVIEIMNGNISVKSKKGEGSEFTVTVTLADSMHIDQESGDVKARNLRVLIIEQDGGHYSETSQNIMSETGIIIETKYSGKEGLDLVKLRHARQEAFDLILIDMDMPGQNGINVVSEIQKIIGKDSSIIILVAENVEEAKKKTIAVSVDRYMKKPFFIGDVLYEYEEAMKTRALQEMEQEEEFSLEGRKILLAEDVFINAEIMKEVLGMRGMKVDVAENGLLAVEMFREKPIDFYDAILMDVRMPIMDGLAATKAIRQLEREDAKEVPIIALTANAFDEDVQRSLQAGMDAHLTKPADADMIFDILTGFIKRREQNKKNNC